MLRLSSKTRYAVRAVFDVAFHAPAPSQAREVADRQRIPLRFLEQILSDLKRAGILSSKRGPRGGFVLARPPANVTLGDVVRAVEGPIAGVAPRRPRGELREVPEQFLFEVSRSVERCFDDVTILDLCSSEEALAQRRTPAGAYVI